MGLALDRFREKPMPPRLEQMAEDIASNLRNGDPNFLLGYLESSVAIALERPRLFNRDRLAVDLRAVLLARKR
jgi:hypothetical protein